MIKNVLLSGGLGYLGGRITRELVTKGYEVSCGTRRSITKEPSYFPNIRLVKLNWSSIEALAEACLHVECIIHLAAMNEVESFEDPVGAMKANSLASLHLLEAAKLANVKRFIYFSTAHVYGSPIQGDIDEKVLPRPIHPYAITHKVAEDFILAAHDLGEIEGVVIRLSNAFGAPLSADINRWTLLINDLCRQAVLKDELRLKGSGTQVRDFITLTDVARATDHLLRLDREKLSDGLFNLGGCMPMSVLEVADRVRERWMSLTGRSIEVVRASQDQNPLVRLNYKCEKFLSTGFEHTRKMNCEIDETLRLCLRSFKNL